MSIERIAGHERLAQIIAELGIGSGPIWIKVNWTSPHRGMYTTPEVLESLLSVLPRTVIIAEGHSVGRLLIPLKDLPEDESAAREVVREGDRAFLNSTNMERILDMTGVGYFNVTEAVWAGEIAPPGVVERAVKQRFGALEFPELLSVVPRALYRAHANVTLINLARMKVPKYDDGDWSLALKNMFGLIPDPYRIEYHRRGLAEAIFDINRVYRSLFRVVDIVEGLESVVVYSDDGELKAPWGRYDLREDTGLLAWGEEPAALEREIAAHFGRDLSKRRLTQLAEGAFEV
ncbi:MAG: DUF362 domain-containing protein [Clostridia bacterium]